MYCLQEHINCCYPGSAYVWATMLVKYIVFILNNKGPRDNQSVEKIDTRIVFNKLIQMSTIFTFLVALLHSELLHN